MAAPGHIQPQAHAIPLDIRKDLPNQMTPWKISEGIFAQMAPQKGKYKKVEVLPTDPEWRFVWRYFYHDKPKRWGIGRVYCIHERHQQISFEFGLSSIEREADKFKPSWDQEPRAQLRAKAIERWKEASQIFSPFVNEESDGRKRNWSKTKILPLWHGTSKEIADSVSESGFVYFGKTSLGHTSSDPHSTDEGFFGSGIYFSNSARYVSDIYSSGHILMAWVSMREPFPVVGDPVNKDMALFQGKGAYKHYNAHYVPVTSIDPSSPYECMYYPTKKEENPHCDEIVVFHKSQALPRFWVELTVESPTIMSPSNIPMFVNELIPHLFKILEHPQVDRDQKLRNYLNQELAFLLKLKGDDYLEDHGEQKYETLYGHMTQLIVQGEVNRQVSRMITALSFADKLSPWRVLSKGLNLEAQCETNSCEAYQKMVWIRNGFGKFDIIDLIFERSIKCPICNQKTKDPVNFGFYDCKYKIEGKMLEPERKKVTVEDNAPSNKFTTFKLSDTKWASLQITIL